MKKFTLLLAIILALGCIGTVAMLQNDEVVEKIVTIFNGNSDPVYNHDNLISILKEQNYDPDEIERAVDRYSNMVVINNPNDKETSLFLEMVSGGKDIVKLLDICDFLCDSPEKFDLLKPMYEYGEEVDFEGRYWLEDAYNYSTDKKQGVLTGGEISTYLNKGLTTDDIRLANILSRKGEMTITEILDEKTTKEWADIYSKLYSDEMSIDTTLFKDEKDGYKIYTVINMAKISNEDVNAIYSRAKENYDSEIASVLQIKETKKQEFKINNAIEYKISDAEEKQLNDRLENLGLPEDELNAVANIFTVKEIEKAAQISEATGYSVVDILNSYELENTWIDEGGI